MCKLCTAPRHHLLDGSCIRCPSSGYSALAMVAFIVLLNLLPTLLFVWVWKHRPTHKRIVELFRRTATAFIRLGLVAKLKLLLGYYQLVVAMPLVYDIRLPAEYRSAMKFMDLVHLDWLATFLPPKCFGDYGVRLALDAGLPLFLSFLFVLVGALVHVTSRRLPELVLRPTMRLWVKKALEAGLLASAPYALFLCFAFAPGVSSHIFSVRAAGLKPLTSRLIMAK